MSSGILQHLLNKQHMADNKVDDSDGASNRSERSSNDGGSVPDLSNISPALSITNLAVSREQCACLSQLLQSLNGLVVGGAACRVISRPRPRMYWPTLNFLHLFIAMECSDSRQTRQ